MIKEELQQELQEELNLAYQELDAAECDLHCFTETALAQGELEWIADQKEFISYLKHKIKTLKEAIKEPF